ncbi:hypothetical protein FRX31_022927 [Thalictrum thalictroides]|uniref:Uncharacterized protein n=1 Tax=Thalictrum thalictroides TaxID=46969 RepID=A0A7J6VSE6_THATH|nr:hypothetical protein FRX31_022927 [Thalictrum thalictroides]
MGPYCGEDSGQIGWLVLNTHGSASYQNHGYGVLAWKHLHCGDWRVVIVAKYGSEGNKWWPRQTRQSYGCSLWRGIMNNFYKFKPGIRCRLQDGHKIQFLNVVWLVDKPLKEEYPLVCNVSGSSRNGNVVDFGSGIGSENVWELQLRRRLYEWELQQFNLLLEKLGQVMELEMA